MDGERMSSGFFFICLFLFYLFNFINDYVAFFLIKKIHTWHLKGAT